MVILNGALFLSSVLHLMLNSCLLLEQKNKPADNRRGQGYFIRHEPHGHWGIQSPRGKVILVSRASITAGAEQHVLHKAPPIHRYATATSALPFVNDHNHRCSSLSLLITLGGGGKKEKTQITLRLQQMKSPASIQARARRVGGGLRIGQPMFADTDDGGASRSILLLLSPDLFVFAFDFG